jgi:hypothetical protein
MHESNRKWWGICQEQYPEYFKNVENVLEVGSFNVNGSVRDYFSDITNYIGLDWRPGPCVDVVMLAHKYEPDIKFDTIISASMMEHDPFYKESITNMIRLLSERGGLFLSWGAAREGAHEVHSAPDNQFHALPVGKVFTLLESLGMYIHTFKYEANIPGAEHCSPPGSLGEVVLIAFKDKNCAKGEQEIDELVPEDRVYS